MVIRLILSETIGQAIQKFSTCLRIKLEIFNLSATNFQLVCELIDLKAISAVRKFSFSLRTDKQVRASYDLALKEFVIKTTAQI